MWRLLFALGFLFLSNSVANAGGFLNFESYPSDVFVRAEIPGVYNTTWDGRLIAPTIGGVIMRDCGSPCLNQGAVLTASV